VLAILDGVSWVVRPRKSRMTFHYLLLPEATGTLDKRSSQGRPELHPSTRRIAS
jgi:hypothetical protein